MDDNFRVVHGVEIFHVVGYERPERIDQLMVVLAVQTPWPLGSKA